MFIVKDSYKQSVKKRAVQKEVYNSIKGQYKHLVGLGGPDLQDYLKIVKKANIHHATIYEFNISQLLRQISRHTHSPLPLRVIYGDIIQAGVQTDTFYDLDFCGSVKTVEPHIKKFSSLPAMYTFSIRPVGLNDSVKTFVRIATGSENYSMETTRETLMFRKYSITTPKAAYTAYIYKDSVPMLVITNI